MMRFCCVVSCPLISVTAAFMSVSVAQASNLLGSRGVAPATVATAEKARTLPCPSGSLRPELAVWRPSADQARLAGLEISQEAVSCKPG